MCVCVLLLCELAFFELLILCGLVRYVYRASDNWKALKELEKAVKVYWDAKDRLPPRVISTQRAFSSFVRFGCKLCFMFVD